MKKEFNLSKKKLNINNVNWQEVTEFYPEEDVKEFIRLLKAAIKDKKEKNQAGKMEIMWITLREFEEKIDKLAGEKLR